MYLIRTKDEFNWLLAWGAAWRKANPGVQYSWETCLHALEADPLASKIFLPQHKDPRFLNEAHKRYLAKNKRKNGN